MKRYIEAGTPWRHKWFVHWMWARSGNYCTVLRWSNSYGLCGPNLSMPHLAQLWFSLNGTLDPCMEDHHWQTTSEPPRSCYSLLYLGWLDCYFSLLLATHDSDHVLTAGSFLEITYLMNYPVPFTDHADVITECKTFEKKNNNALCCKKHTFIDQSLNKTTITK